MGNQGSRSSVENIFNTHTDIDIKQQVEENCENNDTNVNIVNLGSGNNVNGGIRQDIDSNFSCRLSTTLDSIAKSDITNEQFTKMKTKMNQTGVNLFQNQQNNQRAVSKINNMTDIDQLQSLIKSCNSNKSYYNVINAQDNNEINGGINQSISSAIDCIFDTSASLETTATTSSTSSTDQSNDMSQEGINPFAFLASFGISAIVVIILGVLFFMMSGKKSNNRGSSFNKIGSMVAMAKKIKR